MTPTRRRRDPGNRAVIPWAAVRAAYDAHKSARHDGRVGFVCPTCARYSAAITLARRRDLEGLS